VIKVSLKLVELQVALPRTQDFGKIQEQLQQRGQHMQDQIVVSTKKQNERMRKQVGKSEKSSLHLGQSNQSSETGASKQTKKNQNQKDYHPHIGNHVDISG
jgi:hypothetical protein